MNYRKHLSIIVVLVMLFTILAPSSAFAAGGKGKGAGGGNGTKIGQHGKGGSSSEINKGEDGEGTGEKDGKEGGSGAGADKKGGVNRGGGGGKGNGGGKSSGGQGGSSEGGTEGTEGKVALKVTVDGIPDNMQVHVYLITEENGTLTAETQEHVATFLTSRTGDCTIKGEDVSGYDTPEKSLSITGSQKQFTAALEYKPNNISVTGISLDKSELKLIKNKGYTLKATVSPANANNKNISWSSSKESVATVNENGFVTAAGEGDAIITATSDAVSSIKASCTVTVVTVQSFVSQEAAAVKGQVVTMPKTATAILSEGQEKLSVKWRDKDGAEIGSTFTVPNSNPDSQYVFTGTADGVDKTAVFTINVDRSGQPAVSVTGVTLDKNSFSLIVGDVEPDTLQLNATIAPAGATNKELTWTSSHPEVAAVDQNGLVTAAAIGSTVITVTTVDGNHTANCSISVSAYVEPALISPVDINGVPTTKFDTREDAYINVETLLQSQGITGDTKFYVKVEQKGSDTLLGIGTVYINSSTTQFNLFSVTNYKFTDNYSSGYFVYMSQDSNYPKDDEKTAMTNFKVGGATPTIPLPNIKVNNVITGGPRANDQAGIVFILCRELDQGTNVKWTDYLLNPGSVNSNNPYIDVSKLQFVDEVKLTGKTDANGVVQWDTPKETIKLGGYILLEVTPKGYKDQLNENAADPYGDGTLLKEITLKRNGSVIRTVQTIYDESSDNNQPGNN